MQKQLYVFMSLLHMGFSPLFLLALLVLAVVICFTLVFSKRKDEPDKNMRRARQSSPVTVRMLSKHVGVATPAYEQ
jgi:hypothetical protein